MDEVPDERIEHGRGRQPWAELRNVPLNRLVLEIEASRTETPVRYGPMDGFAKDA